MDLDEYQRLASTTDQNAARRGDDGLTIPLLGIAGETGTLLAEFKKKIRDKESYEGFNARAEEELGDILWYLSSIATRLELSLAEIASKNLRKTQERWPLEAEGDDLFHSFDAQFPESEQLPRVLTIDVSQDANTGQVTMRIVETGEALGDPLTDNAYEDDGYRFHDVFHLAHMAVLGWSPVVRKLLKRKRKSDPKIDEVEDGARAGILEELIVAFVYSNARERKYYSGVRHLDSEMLATIKSLVAHLEVKVRKMKDWESSVMQGYSAFRYLIKHKKAKLIVDMSAKELRVVKQ
jgi:NTP pyrophosphatase (non-canonical NTP hydrolase)